MFKNCHDCMVSITHLLCAIEIIIATLVRMYIYIQLHAVAHERHAIIWTIKTRSGHLTGQYII